MRDLSRNCAIRSIGPIPTIACSTAAGRSAATSRRYLDPRGAQETRILAAGLYSRQLAAFYDRFPSERVLVTFYENILSEPVAQLSQVRHFLGLPPGAAEGFVQRRAKDKTVPMVSPALRRMLGPIKPLVAPFRGTAPFRRMHAALASEIRYTPFPEDLRQRLTDYYAADVESLGALIGRDLSGWLDGQDVPAVGRAARVSATSGTNPKSSRINRKS